MSITIRAVYKGGVLCPVKPVCLAEGETVDITIARPMPPTPTGQTDVSAEDSSVQRLRAARSLDELYAIMATAPSLPDGYDLSEALNANRKATGERPLFADPAQEDRP